VKNVTSCDNSSGQLWFHMGNLLAFTTFQPYKIRPYGRGAEASPIDISRRLGETKERY
jgi:hypothetical protein